MPKSIAFSTKSKVNVAEIRVLRWMCEFTRNVRIIYRYVRESLAVPSMEEKKNIIWDGLGICAKGQSGPLQCIKRLQVQGISRKERLKKTLNEVVRKGTLECGLIDTYLCLTLE